MGVTNECSYSFDADEWEDEHGAQTPVSGLWQCPHESHSDSDRCLFHLSPEERESMGISSMQVSNEFVEKVQTGSPHERWFVGCEFDDLLLSYANIESDSRHPINLHHVTVHEQFHVSFATFELHVVVSHSKFENFDAVSADFGYECYLTNSEIDQLNVRSASFSDYVEFDGSTIGSANLRSVNFGGGTSFEGTIFEGETDFTYSTFGGGNNFRGTVFSGATSFAQTEAKNSLFADVVFGDDADFTDASFERCHFDAVFKAVSFMGATFSKEIDFAAATFDDELIVNMRNAELNGGRLVVQRDSVELSVGNGPNGEQPGGSDIYFDLTRSTLGRVSLTADSANVFDHLILNQTDYDRFDFTRYATELANVDWKIHETSASTDFEDYRALEVTYTKAKEGANAVGNTNAASNFFRTEMRYRRQEYMHSLRETDSMTKRLQYSGKAIANSLLGVLSGYGERPWRVVGISIGVIFASALLYPFLGGISASTGGDSVIYALGGLPGWPLAPPKWITIFGRSLYFSIVTFTTLGYGDYQPATGAVRAVASAEAFSGALLMALLVFVLGRSVRW